MASQDTVDMIRFKHISAQLSDTEMNILMTRLWRSVGRERFLQFLCTSLCGLAANQKYINLLPTASGIISQIIQQRDCEDELNAAVSTTMIDLPACLVGEIASNLDLLDYIAFSKTNRKIFVDCHSPNRLQKLSLQHRHDYAGIRLQHFPQLQHFHFDLSGIPEFYQINGQILSGNNQLQELSVDLSAGSINDIEMLIDDQSKCLSSLQKLCLSSSGSGTGSEYSLESVAPRRFVKLLGKFQGLKKLSLYKMCFVRQINENEVQNLCPLVSKLKLTRVHPLCPFLKIWGPNIITLCYDIDVNEVSHCDLPSLRRLHLASLDFTRFVAFLDISKSASEISLIPNFCGYQEVYSLIKRCIARPKLEYFCVATDLSGRRLRTCCRAIERGLNQTKDIERDWMEITLCVQLWPLSDSDHILQPITDIVIAFVESKVKEWMFVVEFHYFDEKNEGKRKQQIQQYLNFLTNSKDFPPTTVDLKSCTMEEIVITSNDCSLQRHEIWWQDQQPEEQSKEESEEETEEESEEA